MKFDSRASQLPLDAIFNPRVIAVVGATETIGSVGLTLMHNLTTGTFKGNVYPVNPTRPTVCGKAAYKSIAAIPEQVDLVVIATPAATVPGIVRQCVDAGVRGVVIISAGFREFGAPGIALEQQVMAEVKRTNGRMRVIGPNCLGVAIPGTGLNATFAKNIARKGGVAFLSQSGALCTAVLDWSLRTNVGFSAFVSVGSMLDVGWGDLIDYFGDDPNTKAIAIYMESVGDARSFLSAAREFALSKPIIVIKAGRSAQAAAAAASHTGRLTGSDDVVDAAMRRVGVMRVKTITELFDMVGVLDTPRRPNGPRLTIITNAGGPAVLATDALVGAGGELAELSPQTLQALNGVLPPHWSRANPVDILGDAGADRYAEALKIAATDPNADGMLVVLTPQAMTASTATAEKLAQVSCSINKPVFASWMGGDEVIGGREILNRAAIPSFEFPDRAARIFQSLWRYRANLQSLYETVMLTNEPDVIAGRHIADKIVAECRQSGDTILSEHQSKQLLAAYGIPIAATEVADNEAEAVKIADRMGYPVVLKLHSRTLTHKAAVGGVRLNLANSAAVSNAFREIQERVGPTHFLGVTVQPMISTEGIELILGSIIDPQFGPVIAFGLGGRHVEAMKDQSLGLPPLNPTLARRMMETTRIYSALLNSHTLKPADLKALEMLIVRFSRLVLEQKWIREIDINPVLISSGRLIALDGRVILHGPEVTEEQLPTPAIRPYPSKFMWHVEAEDGTAVTVRPIRPDDESLITEFHKGLSDETLRHRYGGVMSYESRVAHERLIRSCFTDYDRHIALVADRVDPLTGRHEILGVGRLIKLHGRNDAEFSLIVADQWQSKGIGQSLLDLLVTVGRLEGLEKITGDILRENRAMLKLVERSGFTTNCSDEGPGSDYRVEKTLIPEAGVLVES